jgi:hypothetical protein
VISIEDFESCPIGRRVEIQLARMEAKLDDTHKSIKTIQQNIEGNGKPGLKSDITALQIRMRILYGVLAAIGVAALGVITGFFKHI